MSDHAAWHNHAKSLADWTVERLVNRSDCCGGYYRRGRAVKRTTRKNLTPDGLAAMLERHYGAKTANRVVGLHTTSPQNTSQWLLLDLDAHTDSEGGEANLRAATAIVGRIEAQGFTPVVLDSDGRGGIHVLVAFESPAPTPRVYALGRYAVAEWTSYDLEKEPETFPKQPQIRKGGYGNWVRLPGRHHEREHWTRLWTGEGWADAETTIDALLRIEGDPIGGLPEPIAAPERPVTTGKDLQAAGMRAPLGNQTARFLAEGAHEGERNARLFAAACDMAGAGYPADQVWERAGRKAVEIGLSETEARQTVQSACSQPRTPINEPETDGDYYDHLSPPEKQGKSGGRPLVSNVITRQTPEGKTTLHPKSIEQATKDLQEVTGGWPQRIGSSQLFVLKGGIDPQDKLRFLNDPDQLFGWIHEQAKLHWPSAGRTVTDAVDHDPLSAVGKKEFFSHLEQAVEPSHVGIGGLPHVPPIEELYYPPIDLPTSSGKALQALVNKLNPDTEDDRYLLTAALATPGWGGPPGSRPAFFFTSDHGRGTGKTSTAYVFAQIWGGCITQGEKEDTQRFRSRLLADDALHQRVVIRDNVRGQLKGADLEAILTAPTIDGHRMYHGHFSRPNYFTWYFTLNAPRLSQDVCNRAVIVKIGRAQHEQGFIEWAMQYVQDHRPAILADIYALLKQEAVCKITHHDRWQTWQRGVLSKLRGGDDLARLIIDRRPAADVDAEEAADVDAELREELCERLHDPDRERIRITRRDMAEILKRRELVGKDYKTKGCTSFLMDRVGGSELGCLRDNPSRKSGQRTWLWEGRDATSDDPIVELKDMMETGGGESPF